MCIAAFELARVTENWGHLFPQYRCWELNSCPVEEEEVLLTTEPSPQPPVTCLLSYIFMLRHGQFYSAHNIFFLLIILHQ